MKTGYLLVALSALILGFAPASQVSAKAYCCPVTDKCQVQDKCAPKLECVPKDPCGGCPSGYEETNKWWKWW